MESLFDAGVEEVEDLCDDIEELHENRGRPHCCSGRFGGFRVERGVFQECIRGWDEVGVVLGREFRNQRDDALAWRRGDEARYTLNPRSRDVGRCPQSSLPSTWLGDLDRRAAPQ